VSASVNLPLHHKVQKFSSGTGSPGWSRKKDHKTVVITTINKWSEDGCSLAQWHSQFSRSYHDYVQLVRVCWKCTFMMWKCHLMLMLHLSML